MAGGQRLQDRTRPIADRRRHYNVLQHSEPRMFRYRRSMQWPPHIAYPYNMGFVAPVRIPVRHYPHRDPLQLCKRWALRRALAPLAAPNWRHWQHKSWRDLVARGDEPDLLYWAPGSELPRRGESRHHLARFPKRALQRIVHSGPMRVLDRFRPRFPSQWKPAQLPDDVVQRIAERYAEIESTLGRGVPISNPQSDTNE